MTPVYLCQCGCGRPATIATYTARDKGIFKGEPLRFINGHNARKVKAPLPPNTAVFCGCGCGKLTEVNSIHNPNRGLFKGVPNKFIYGHNGRIYPDGLDTKSPEFDIWNAMMYRCENPKAQWYHRYGGRGISVIGKMRTFAGFIEVMGKRPGPEFSIDRKDNDGPYQEGNVRWATVEEQNANKHSAKKLTRESVIEIRACRARGESCKDIGMKFNVADSTVRMVATRKTWKHVASEQAG